MKLTNSRRLAALAVSGALITASIALPVAADAISDAIKQRQSAYTYLGWNAGRIKQELDRSADDFDRNRVKQAANAIAAAANSGLGELFVPGSDEGTGWKATRLKSEFFQQQSEVVRVATEFNRAANDLASSVESGSHAELSRKFEALGESCRGCHQNFRAAED